MMTDKLPDDVRDWSPEHVKQYLEKHINSSKYNDEDIKKIYDQEIDGESFLLLTRMELISESLKIKVGHTTGIMKLVEKLKETQG